jgi:hypothetical protein
VLLTHWMQLSVVCCACTFGRQICGQLQWPHMLNDSVICCVSACALNELACCLQDDAADAQWFPVGQLPSLAFDHKEVVRTVFEKLTQRHEVRTEGSLCRVVLQLDFCSMVQMHHGRRTFKSEPCDTGCSQVQMVWSRRWTRAFSSCRGPGTHLRSEGRNAVLGRHLA